MAQRSNMQPTCFKLAEKPSQLHSFNRLQLHVACKMSTGGTHAKSARFAPWHAPTSHLAARPKRGPYCGWTKYWKPWFVFTGESESSFQGVGGAENRPSTAIGMKVGEWFMLPPSGAK